MSKIIFTLFSLIFFSNFSYACEKDVDYEIGHPCYSEDGELKEVNKGTAGRIDIDKAQRYFRVGERPVKTIKVSNNSTDKDLTIFTEVILERGPEGSSIKDNEAFLFAPKRFTLKAGESRSVRMVYKKPFDDNERVYLVHFKPEHNKGDEDNKNADSVTMGTSVIITHGMLLLVSPKEVKNDLVWERDETGVTFTNNGNVAVDMRRRLNYCFGSKEEENEDNCKDLPGKRIYPGDSWKYEVEGHKSLEYYYAIYNKVQRPVKIKPMY